jgi:hypothetical protein
MRSTLIVLLAAIALSCTSFAQVPGVAQGNAFEASPGVWHAVLTNKSASSLVAHYAFFTCGPKSGSSAMPDARLYSGDRDVSPGENLEITAADPSQCTGGVKAAIFSDGHGEGDPHLLAELYARRRGAYDALGEAIELLDSIQNEQSIPNVVDTLTSRRNAIREQKTLAAAGSDYVFSLVLHTLDDSSYNVGLPSDDKGQTAPAVADATNANGVSREQARLIVLSNRLKAWRLLLEQNLQPPAAQ